MAKLKSADAPKVWLMHWDGLYQHQIAACFGVNQGRISDILNNKTHQGSCEIAQRLKRQK
jgi:predicted XRE-type DNA-binding protein